MQRRHRRFGRRRIGRSVERARLRRRDRRAVRRRRCARLVAAFEQMRAARRRCRRARVRRVERLQARRRRRRRRARSSPRTGRAANGSTPVPASAPNSTALMTLPDCSAASAMSKRTKRFAAAARVREQRVAGDPAVAERGLLGDRVDAVRRRDQRRPVGRDEAALDGAPALHQLGREDDVDVARQRHERQHRLGAVALGVALRIELDVVDRRAGALGDAGHRRRLREPAVRLAEVDDPVGEDAAALAAHGQDRDLDRRRRHLAIRRP